MGFGFDQCDPRECFSWEVLGLAVRIILQRLLGEKLRGNGQARNCREPRDGSAVFSVIAVGNIVGLRGRNASSGRRASPWPVPICYGLAKCRQFISGPSSQRFHGLPLCSATRQSQPCWANTANVFQSLGCWRRRQRHGWPPIARTLVSLQSDRVPV